MKNLFKKFFLLVFAGLLVVGSTACNKKTPVEDEKTPAASEKTPAEKTPAEKTPAEKTPAEKTPEVTGPVATPTPETPVPTEPTPETPVVEKLPFTEENFAHGAISYVAASYDERTEILGKLEKYAVKNNLTGLTLYEDGGYVMYHPSVVKGTNNYIPGYGFGILTEGYLDADLEGETNAAWKRYYHTFLTEDPSTINYMNDKGSVVGDIITYTTSSYFGTAMNETGDGYEWINVQSNTERPEAVNGVDYDGTILATKYRFEVKVGAEYKYNTLSSAFSKYNGVEVKLEDYVTPYKIYYTQAYSMARGSENLDGAGSIKGSAEYYDASAEGFNQNAWDKIGIKAYVDEEDGKSYLEFEFNTPCNQFYAMYYLSSGMFSPVPEQFIKDLGNGDLAEGVKSWGNKTDSGLSPVDTWLSTGAYTLERWDTDQQIVFKKNPFYDLEGDWRYQIEGVHLNILSSANEDPLAALKEFEANKLHACSIPFQKLNEYKDDERTTTTVGSSTYKLNFNTCTQEEWVALFGVDGSITRTEEANYWLCEPIMSNDDFLKGLNYAINRADFAATMGRTPSNNYFGSGYLSNPEEGIMYNQTQAHKDAMAELSEGTIFGYNLEFAKASFKKAAADLIANGTYSAGQTISIEVAWQTPADEDDYHAIIKKYIEDAWKAADTGLNLELVFWAGESWSDVYYEKMMVGQFDIGFGSVSGNTLNPLNFLEVLRSDNTSGFTLNWGCDTSVVSEELYHDGMYWSFNSLWEAADKGGYFEKGQIVPALTAPDTLDTTDAEQFVENADGTVTFTVLVEKAVADGLEVKVSNVQIYGYLPAGGSYSDTGENVAFEEVDGVLTVTLTAEQYATWSQAYNVDGYLMLDVYYVTSVNNIDSESLTSVYFLWPVADAE